MPHDIAERQDKKTLVLQIHVQNVDFVGDATWGMKRDAPGDRAYNLDSSRPGTRRLLHDANHRRILPRDSHRDMNRAFASHLIDGIYLLSQVHH
jgi:hypothetical protein